MQNKSITKATELPFEWIGVQKSFLSEFRYHAENKTLDIKLSSGNSTYRYADVPHDIVDDFLAADHKGTFFSVNIRKQFTAEKLAEGAK